VSYAIDNTSPPYVGMMQQPTINTDDSETVPDQSSTCLSSPVLHMPEVRASGLNVVTSSSPSNISVPLSTSLTCDDEPLSTPPALDVPEEASQSFFPPAQMPILDNSANCTANGGFVPPLALDSGSSDIPFANQVVPVEVVGEQVQKKKRKRKSDAAGGEDGGSSTAKRSRKKKPKANDADTGQVLPADCSQLTESSIPPVVVEDTAVNTPANQPPPKMKKSNKDSSAAKTPRVPKEKKIPKEPKTPKEPKSSKSKRSSTKVAKVEEKTEDGVDAVAAAVEVAEVGAEDDGTPLVIEEKPKPTPRPKPKKKRLDFVFGFLPNILERFSFSYWLVSNE